jgi:hypothetical protein
MLCEACPGGGPARPRGSGGGTFECGEFSGGERRDGGAFGREVAEPWFGDDGIIELPKDVLQVRCRVGERVCALAE